MADTVTSNVLSDGPRNHVVALTNVSDGTGESAVVKVNVSDLVGPDGKNAPSYCAIKSVQYDVQGFTDVRIAFDATSDDTALVLSGQGYMDFTDQNYFNDPQSTGTTGDVLLTTTGAASGDTYTITLHLIKKQ